MAALYRKGHVLEEIGRVFDLTRERVRQILRANGVDKYEGGGALKTLQRVRNKIQAKIDKAEKRERKALKYYGCSYAQVHALGPISRKRTPAHRYKQQRNSAARRKIKWDITLPDWWRIWSESGKWDDCGLGGYCMSRYGDCGPYSVDNVRIISMSENSKEYQATPRAKEHWRRLKERQKYRPKNLPCWRGHAPSERNARGNCRKCETINKKKYLAKKKLRAA